MSIFGYQSDPPSTDTSNQQSVVRVAATNINSTIVSLVGTSATYAVVNENLIIPHNIQLQRVGGAGSISENDPVVKIPIPLTLESPVVWTALTTEGNLCRCQLTPLGLLLIEGDFSSDQDTLPIHFPNYVARTPLEISRTPVFNNPLQP